jgi:hypothetical protein
MRPSFSHRRYRCRCTHCRARQSFQTHPRDFGQHPPVCISCGSRTWAIDSYRQSGKEAACFTCRCDGFPYPHRKGSGADGFSCIHETDTAAFNRHLREAGIGSKATNPGEF